MPAWHLGITNPPKPVKPLPNPFANLGVEGSGYATRNAVAPPIVPPAVAPPPVDFSTLVGNDAEYKRQQAQLAAQNQLSMDALLKGFQGQAQGSQDSYNAHGGLFSGAAVNAQRNLAQGYEGQVRQQTLNYQGQAGDALTSAWQRLLQQLAGGA